MRLCFVYEYYYPHVGGGEILIQHLAEGLAARGHECTVVTSRLPGTADRERLNGVQIRRVKVPHRADRYWFTAFSLPAVLDEVGKADIVHAATYNGAAAAWIAGHAKNKPVVLHPFEVLGRLWLKLGINPASAGAFLVFEKLVLSLPFDAYSCISQHTMNALIGSGVPAQKTFLAYPGIDYSLFDPGRVNGRAALRRQLNVDDDTFLCMYSGRPGFIKGLEFLVDAIPEVKRKIPNARFLLLLSRQPKRKYRKTLAALSRLGKDDFIIRDPVSREQLPDYFQASDCVVVPSLNEGFGFTCVEACTMERPVVVSGAGSLPEVVSGKYVIVAPGSAAAIADGIGRAHRGDLELSDIKRFSVDDSIEQHVQACEQLLQGHDLTSLGSEATTGQETE